MKQMDLFDKTYEGKLDYLERRMEQMRKDLWWLKEINNLSKKVAKITTFKKHVDQLDIFGT